MKEGKSGQEKSKRNAEEWVTVARQFGEKCVEIQHDPKLSIDQKLEKQKALSNTMIKEIQEDSHLKEEDKQQMIDSINNYMNEWTSMHNAFQKAPKEEKNTK